MKKSVRIISLLIVIVIGMSILSTGALAAGSTGWRQNAYGEWYYLSSGSLAFGWKKISGSWYYFDDSGIMLSDGLYELSDGNYYYFLSSGRMATGWRQVPFSDGSVEWLYFNSDGSLFLDGWKKLGGYWYYFEDGFYYHGGLAVIDSREYYFQDNGHMYTGWIHFYDDYGSWVGWAYFQSSGARIQSGSGYIGGRYYSFSDGFML